MKSGQTPCGPPPPPLLKNAPTRDHRAETARITAANPTDSEFRGRFARHRVHQLRTHPDLDEPTRITMADALADRLRGEIPMADGEPVPSGVGRGFYYTRAFREAWDLGTSMACNYVCPRSAGGNSANTLYVTSMNRAGWGCEPLILYQAQEPARFKVWDWALANQKKDPWVVDRPLSALGDYLTTKIVRGRRRPVIGIWNSTYAIDDDYDDDLALGWRNTVHLANRVAGTWDLQHQYDYRATEADQKPSALGDAWAPIIETFQPHYVDTNPMGALNIQLCAENFSEIWSPWTLLDPGDSRLSDSDPDFLLELLIPNHAFVAIS